MQLFIEDKQIEYNKAMKWFEDLTEEKIFVFEHQDIYTAGKSIDNNEKEKNISNIHGIPAIHTSRGGLWTWHGKGQIVVYFIYNIKKRHLTLSDFLLKIESIIIENVKKELFKYDNTTNFNIFADNNKRGFWYKNNKSKKENNNEKFGFIGLRVSKGFVLHGISINYNNNLAWFDYINPCGLGDVKITSIENILIENSKFNNHKQILDINNFKINLGKDLFSKL